MKAVVQRVAGAWVDIQGNRVAAIGQGLLILLGVEKGDMDRDATWMSEKIVNLRIFEDDAGKMNLSVRDTMGGILIVSQFTLAGNCSKGRRPSFDSAAEPDIAIRLYDHFVAEVKKAGISVETGVFQADMQVGLVNDGPVTFILESPLRGSA